MLPDLPSTKRDISRHLLLALSHRIENRSPVLRDIRRFTQHEGFIYQYPQIGFGKVTDGFEKLSAELNIDVAEVPDLIGAKMNAKLDSIADSMSKKMAESFYRKVGEASDIAGNSINAAGRSMSPDLILDLMDRVQMAFDPFGKPTTSFVIHPEMTETLQRSLDEIEHNDELRQRFEGILARQRDAWAVRESNRKLVD